MVLSLLLLVDFTVFNVPAAKALDKKSVLVGVGVGAAAGAGIVLAAPAIAGAVGAAGGIAGIGAGIVGAIGAAAGFITGALAAVGGAIAAAGGALVGWIAGLIASPLFIPALIVIGVVVAGYLIYRHYKKKQTNVAVLPENQSTIVTPGMYDMNPVIPPMNQNYGITIGDSDGLVIQGNAVTISSTPPVDAVIGDVQPDAVKVPGNEAFVAGSTNLKAAEARYQAAYKAYTKLVTTDQKGDVDAALKEYKAASDAYNQLKKAAGIK